jgi:hypothetical protein
MIGLQRYLQILDHANPEPAPEDDSFSLPLMNETVTGRHWCGAAIPVTMTVLFPRAVFARYSNRPA